MFGEGQWVILFMVNIQGAAREQRVRSDCSRKGSMWNEEGDGMSVSRSLFLVMDLFSICLSQSLQKGMLNKEVNSILF